jgi:hypothetical protein
MELMAPIQGLLALQEPCEVEITTDSKYVVDGMNKWISTWKQKLVPNADLWIETSWVRFVGTECGSHSAKFLGGWKAARTSPSQPGGGLRAAQTPSRSFPMTQGPMQLTRTVFNDNWRKSWGMQ